MNEATKELQDWILSEDNVDNDRLRARFKKMAAARAAPVEGFSRAEEGAMRASRPMKLGEKHRPETVNGNI